jgi:putative hydrolase of the HAD superfamily
MSPRPPLAAVLFDLDDTLHDDTLTYRRAARRVAEDVAASHGVETERLLTAYIEQSETFWKGLSADRLGTPLVALRASMWRAALVVCGIDDPALAERCGHAYNDYRRGLLQLWPGAAELLARLRAKGLRLALITNGFAETHREKIALLALEDVFDEVFIADEVGMVKPDPRLFRLAAERLGVAPEACAMVGDRFDRDVVGAHAVRMFTVWMNVRGESVPPDGPQPGAIVERIDDVEAALPPERSV